MILDTSVLIAAEKQRLDLHALFAAHESQRSSWPHCSCRRSWSVEAAKSPTLPGIVPGLYFPSCICSSHSSLTMWSSDASGSLPGAKISKSIRSAHFRCPLRLFTGTVLSVPPAASTNCAWIFRKICSGTGETNPGSLRAQILSRRIPQSVHRAGTTPCPKFKKSCGSHGFRLRVFTEERRRTRLLKSPIFAFRETRRDRAASFTYRIRFSTDGTVLSQGWVTR